MNVFFENTIERSFKMSSNKQKKNVVLTWYSCHEEVIINWFKKRKRNQNSKHVSISFLSCPRRLSVLSVFMKNIFVENSKRARYFFFFCQWVSKFWVPRMAEREFDDLGDRWVWCREKDWDLWLQIYYHPHSFRSHTSWFVVGWMCQMLYIWLHLTGTS